MQRRDGSVAQSLGIPLTKRVKESRVLLVGAGGIGCEVLKDLVCCGFGSPAERYSVRNGTSVRSSAEEVLEQRQPGITVVDVDTIDLSNLNRQVLFRKRHIKKAKALVAKETVSHFNPSVNIEAHHASILDQQYSVSFFASFDLVFNALDNVAARRHVNRMCLAANVALIESGTTGFNGQVQAIKKGVTECYDCNPKPVQKSFPICTIRSTPSQPIHCIVWAKSYLFPELFGTSEDDPADVAVTEADDAEEVAKLKEEAQALKKVRAMMGKGDFAREVFNKVFTDDIARLRSMGEMWQSRKAPEALSFEQLIKGVDADIGSRGQALAVQDQSVWSLHDNLAVFCYALDTLSNRAQAGEKVMEFDKDDKDTLDFVAAAANLRSHIFGIPLHSEWEIKQMAGNIIPAIATSNALAASLCVMQAFKILRSQPQEQAGLSKPTANNHLPTATQYNVQGGKEEQSLGGSKMVFLNSRSTERMITTQALAPPRPDCPVCSPVYLKLRIPAKSTATLHHLVDLLREKLKYDEFSIMAEQGIIFDPDLDDNLEKPLSEYVSADNRFLTVTDDTDEAKVDLILSAITSATVESRLELVPEQLSLPLKPKKAMPETNGDVDQKAELVRVLSTTAAKKRKREAEEEIESAKKRTKADGSSVNDAYQVEDDGAILIDD